MRALLAAALLCGGSAFAQTTQGEIWGRATSMLDGSAVAAARIEYEGIGFGRSGAAVADAAGWFRIYDVSPGRYRFRVSAPRYQAKELYDLDVPVAGYLRVDFALRPLSDVWEQGRERSLIRTPNRGLAPFFGPDLDFSRFASLAPPAALPGGLEAALSSVIGERWLNDVPLAGRDAYTMLVVLPGVSSDGGTSRGLGLTVFGQRPSASNFLLDGAESNNSLVSGTLFAPPPETLDEYRISTSSFSAEYGRTAGFLANAVSRRGGDTWRMGARSYFQHEALDANQFQWNRQGVARGMAREFDAGVNVGGPLRRRRDFLSASFDALRSRKRGDPVSIELPSASYARFTAPSSAARKLLDLYGGGLPQSESPLVAQTVTPPVSLDRRFFLARFDHQAPIRYFARIAGGLLQRPDFLWTPYPEFASPLNQTTLSAVAGAAGTLHGAAFEVRAAFTHDDLHWDRPHPELASLTAASGTWLPGSPAFYAYRNRNRSLELSGTASHSRGAHSLKAGAGMLVRGIAGQLTAGRDGRFVFGDYFDFTLDRPVMFQAAVARGTLTSPNYARTYRNNQWSAFVQDSWRLVPSFTVNAGLRLEAFGAPINTSPLADLIVTMPSTGSAASRIAAASLIPGRDLHAGTGTNAALRAGFSWRATADGRTVVRGAWGEFHDRPFDNLWQNVRANSWTLLTAPVGASNANYLQPAEATLARYGAIGSTGDIPSLTAYSAGMKTPRSRNWFAGVERMVGESLQIAVAVLGASGGHLVVTDQVNRPSSVAPSFPANPTGRLNPALPTISLRSDGGSSAYRGLSATANYRTRHAQLIASYTLGRATDNQSEPLAGDFFDLSFTRVNAGDRTLSQAAFSRQFDGAGDHGYSDFDQRHNFTLASSWALPGKWKGWRVSQMASARSGFPFSMLAPGGFGGTEVFYSRRADRVASSVRTTQAVAGGVAWLNAAAFATPPDGRQGNTARNAFRAPGFFSADLSLGRTFALAERTRVTLRADAFNALNHTNLGMPASVLGQDGFGVAAYGRTGHASAFPGVIPLAESARHLQLLLRVEF